MRDTLHAFRLALRALLRAPAFTGAAVVALALGIGGSTVVFSVVNTLLLQPLPYADPDRLVVCDPGPPWALYEQWRTADVFDGMAAYNERAANVSGAGEPERIIMARVTPNFLSVVGVKPAIGRAFGPQSEADGDKIVLLTDAFWRKHYGGARDVVGRTLRIDDQAYTVIGVLPRQFKTVTQLMPAVGLSFDWGAAVFVPLLRDPLRREPASTDMFWRGMKLVARLSPGVTLEQARAAAGTIAKTVKLPAYLAGRSFTLERLTDFVAGELPAQMAILAAAVGLLLLVAGANVANLLLARGTARQRELATRAALGASAGQLVRHALTESLVLGLAGGLLGIAAAWGGVRVVSAFGGPVLARLDAVGLDLRVLAFACVLSMAVGLLAGIVPALRLAHAAPAAALQVRRGYARVRGRVPLSSVLVFAEVVVSLVLVLGAGLLARDFTTLASADLGFRPEGVLTADVSLSRVQYPKTPQVGAFFADLLDRAAGLPGIRSAALSSVAPAGSAVMSVNMQVEGPTRGANAGAAGALAPEDHEYTQVVGGNYFRTLTVPIVEGRPLDSRDAAGTEHVVVVNEAFARKYWDSPRQAMRHRVMLGGYYTIVGVAGDLHDVASTRPPLPLVYFALPQSPWVPSQMTVLLKGPGDDAAALAAPLTRLMRQVNPNQPLYNVLTLDRIVSTQLARRRLIMTMMAVFAGLALLLAAAGVYGVLSYAVAQRAHELGVRMAIGGSRRDVFSLVLGRGMRLVGFGVVAGLPIAYALTRVLAAQLVGVTRTDAPTYVASTVLVGALGLFGCAVPAWRATRVDPIVTLRSE
ncbi:MAG: FtsX-like permease family protein [Acidobacteria bacterium]|nr:MAG: FtsX-like permease family protein [Acidobacteriota bacterium]